MKTTTKKTTATTINSFSAAYLEAVPGLSALAEKWRRAAEARAAARLARIRAARTEEARRVEARRLAEEARRGYHPGRGGAPGTGLSRFRKAA